MFSGKERKRKHFMQRCSSHLIEFNMGAIASSNQMILTKKINCIVKRYLAERIFAKYPRADFNALSA